MIPPCGPKGQTDASSCFLHGRCLSAEIIQMQTHKCVERLCFPPRALRSAPRKRSSTKPCSSCVNQRQQLLQRSVRARWNGNGRFQGALAAARLDEEKEWAGKNDFCWCRRRGGTDSSLVWRRGGKEADAETSFWDRCHDGEKKLKSGCRSHRCEKLNLLSHLALPLCIIWKYWSILVEVWLWFFSPLHPTELIFGKSWHDRACWRFVISVLTGCGSEKKGVQFYPDIEKKKKQTYLLFYSWGHLSANSC